MPGRSFRHCRWIPAVAARRIAPSKVRAFTRAHRDARNVDPELQDQWMEVRCPEQNPWQAELEAGLITQHL